MRVFGANEVRMMVILAWICPFEDTCTHGSCVRGEVSVSLQLLYELEAIVRHLTTLPNDLSGDFDQYCFSRVF